jgi:ectoine hydroxylase-related dioxygenase (phytanoyl-CoA dioxygenase family)
MKLMPELETLHSHEQEAIVTAVARDGACIVADLLDSTQCAALLDDFKQHLTDMPWGVDELGYKSDFYGAQTKRLHGLFSKSKHMEAVLTHPLLLQLANSVLLDEKKSRDFRLSNAELMVLAEHQTVQEFHTDAGSWFHAQRLEAPQEILLSANIALTDFTASNGATRVVPGSHLWERGRIPQPHEITQAIMPKGAGLIYSGNVIHSGGANSDADIRVGLYLGYVVSWLRPLENQLITNDAEDILALGDRAKQLLDIVPGGFTVIA